jgi:hypothetical protein
MKKLSLPILLAVFILSCEDEPFSPSQASISTEYGWPDQQIRIFFDNPGSAAFDVMFGSTKANATAASDGLYVVVPKVQSDETYNVILKTPKGELSVLDNFLVRGYPKVTYISSDTVALRKPVKVVVKNLDFFTGGSQAYVCGSSEQYPLCSGGAMQTSVSGDTIVYSMRGKKGTNYFRIVGEPGIQLANATESRIQALRTIMAPKTVIYSASFAKINSSAKAGGNLDIIFNDPTDFPDRISVSLRNSQGTFSCSYVTFDIAGGAGYTNALAGRYKVPTLPPGKYTIVAKETSGLRIMPEGEQTFTIVE